MMLNFNIPPYIGEELDFIKTAVQNKKICGDGEFTALDSEWMERRFQSKKILLTTSCTHALEMSALLTDIKEGDEVIMPSYTFVSTADAFVMRGAKIIFVDIRPDTMNIDEKLISNAITNKTKAIVPVHYAGVSCEMNKIMDVANESGLYVIEDAAQGIMSEYNGKALGTIGHLGCYSFHETKNYSMGEGGALSINSNEYIDQAEIIREKGTDRSRFFRGLVDKYTWVSCGSSYLPSELNAAYLWAQLRHADEINQNRIESWELYYRLLKPLEESGKIELPTIPAGCTHNAHMFYIKVSNLDERGKLIKYLKEQEIMTVFHYIPLHSSPAGKKFGAFCGRDVYTTRESERLLRLPLYYGLAEKDIIHVVDKIFDFYGLKM